MALSTLSGLSQLYEAFQRLDVDENGEVGLDEIRTLFADSQDFEEAELDEILLYIDQDKNGRVSWDELWYTFANLNQEEAGEAPNTIASDFDSLPRLKPEPTGQPSDSLTQMEPCFDDSEESRARFRSLAALVDQLEDDKMQLAEELVNTQQAAVRITKVEQTNFELLKEVEDTQSELTAMRLRVEGLQEANARLRREKDGVQDKLYKSEEELIELRFEVNSLRAKVAEATVVAEATPDPGVADQLGRVEVELARLRAQEDAGKLASTLESIRSLVGQMKDQYRDGQSLITEAHSVLSQVSSTVRHVQVVDDAAKNEATPPMAAVAASPLRVLGAQCLDEDGEADDEETAASSPEVPKLGVAKQDKPLDSAACEPDKQAVKSLSVVESGGVSRVPPRTPQLQRHTVLFTPGGGDRGRLQRSGTFSFSVRAPSKAGRSRFHTGSTTRLSRVSSERFPLARALPIRGPDVSGVDSLQEFILQLSRYMIRTSVVSTQVQELAAEVGRLVEHSEGVAAEIAVLARSSRQTRLRLRRGKGQPSAEANAVVSDIALAVMTALTFALVAALYGTRNKPR